jgi:flagellar assembly factor FliW
LDKQNNNGTITIQNVELGELAIQKDTIIQFNKGIVGFENLRRFALVDIKECAPFLWCVAVDEPEISFPILEYNQVFPNFELELSDKDRNDLEIADATDINLFFVITVDENKEVVSANLKGPLVINPNKKLGAQVVLANEQYVVNYPII